MIVSKSGLTGSGRRRAYLIICWIVSISESMKK